MDTTRIAVVGGGLAGLVAARHLADDGADVTLYERRDELGGRVRTTREDGHVYDRGFQVLFTAYPAARRELDYDALDLRAFDPGATVCRPGERSTLADPLRDPGTIPASLSSDAATFADKLRVLALRGALARKSFNDCFRGSDESTEQYLRDWGFSERFLDRFARPFYGGITLDRSLSTSRRVFEFTFKCLSAGKTVVPATGMQAIPEYLAGRVQDADASIELGRAVDAVEPVDDGVMLDVDGETVSADATVVATDPPTARDLTGVSAVPTEGKGCVTQYFTVPADVSLGSRIHLNAAGKRPNTVADMTAVAPEHAPADRTLLAATTLGRPAATDAELAETVRETVRSWYPDTDFGDFALRQTERIPFAQFAQPPGVHESLPDTRDPEGAVYLAGDYTLTSSIQGALASGYTAAKAVREDE